MQNVYFYLMLFIYPFLKFLFLQFLQRSVIIFYPARDFMYQSFSFSAVGGACFHGGRCVYLPLINVSKIMEKESNIVTLSIIFMQGADSSNGQNYPDKNPEIRNRELNQKSSLEALQGMSYSQLPVTIGTGSNRK
jgi:hypothetical protein